MSRLNYFEESFNEDDFFWEEDDWDDDWNWDWLDNDDLYPDEY